PIHLLNPPEQPREQLPILPAQPLPPRYQPVYLLNKHEDPQTQPLALPNQLLPPRHQPIHLIDKHEDPQTQRLALPNQPPNISLLRSDPVPLASRTAVVAEGSIMIPPAFVRDFPLRLRNAGISEGMVYNAAPLNEFSPDSYPRGPIPFPRVEGLPDPLCPTYAQNEHTETTPTTMGTTRYKALVLTA
ncbi:hypothetical protein D6D27_07451, partial [Aureobasidium pullulans]